MERQINILLSGIKRRCPSMFWYFQSLLANPHTRHATDALAVLFVIQNREIHDEAMRINPGFTLAERECYWIDIDGPKAFFAKTRAFHPELFTGNLYAGFNAFQLLLLGFHAEFVARRLGRVPKPEELLDDEWNKWCGRLRQRFGPILQGRDYATSR